MRKKIRQLLNALDTVQSVKEEIVNMEQEAKKHYMKAKEFYDMEDRKNYRIETEVGNALMERVVSLKLIVGQ